MLVLEKKERIHTGTFLLLFAERNFLVLLAVTTRTGTNSNLDCPPAQNTVVQLKREDDVNGASVRATHT